MLHVMGSRKSAAHQNVERYRERMRRAGLRLVQLWMPDTRDAAFAKECRRQSLLVARDARAGEGADELESLQDTTEWRR